MNELQYACEPKANETPKQLVIKVLTMTS